MQLVKRLNYILLPVISALFLVITVIVYLGIVEMYKNALQEKWLRILDMTQQEIALEIKGIRSDLLELVNSANAIDLLHGRHSEFDWLNTEQQLYQTLRRNIRRGYGVQTLQLIDTYGDIRVSVDEQSPFAPPQLLAMPNQMAERAFNLLNNKERSKPFESIYANDQGHAIYALAQQFNPDLPSPNDYQLPFADNFLVLQKAQLRSFNQFEKNLNSELSGQYQMELLPPDLSHEFGIYAEPQPRQLNLALNNPNYRIRLTIDYTVLNPKIREKLLNIIQFSLLMTALSFLIQRWLIKSKIVEPIDRLVKTINEADLHDASTKLAIADDNDEVSRLNNAYLGLMQNVQQLANFDPLTGLANRHSFQDWLARVLPRSGRSNDDKLALLFIDLDNFKRVNDQHGHSMGDQLLQEFAKKLRSVIRAKDSLTSISVNERNLARLAGDEFAVLLSDIESADEVIVVAKRINDLFVDGFKVNEVRYNVQASIGIAIYPDDGVEAETLIAHADAAMYQAKSEERNSYRFFSAEIAAALHEKQRIEGVLLQSLEQDQFELVYMPIYRTGSLKIASVEALLRCPLLTAQGIGPDQFIPIAESTGLIRKIDLWVLERAIQHLLMLQQQHDFQGLMAINISASELHNQHFARQVQEVLEAYNVDPACIELEITETSLVADDAETQATLTALKQLGVRLSLDDFGTGYTAFNQLASYPVDVLKIDRSFVNRIGDADHGKSMLEIIVSLARLYQLEVIAEGVETKLQLDYLKQVDCEKVQGFYLDKPLPFLQLKRKLRELSAAS